MKSKFTANLFAFLLAALVIATGITIPSILLDRQEEDILGNKKMFTMQEKQPLTGQEPNNPQILYGEELLTKFSAWNNMVTEMIREPYNNELSMEGAFFTAKSELQKLIDTDAIPSIPIQDYRLSNAQFMAKSKPVMAIWDLTLTYMEDTEQVEINTAQIEIDAETGNIYSIILVGHETNDVPDRNRLALFAEYYGIIGGKPESMNDEMGFSEATLQVGRLLIYVSSSATSDEAPKYTVKMESLQDIKKYPFIKNP